MNIRSSILGLVVVLMGLASQAEADSFYGIDLNNNLFEYGSALDLWNNQNPTFHGGGAWLERNEIFADSAPAAPEPGTTVLLLCGGALLFWRRFGST